MLKKLDLIGFKSFADRTAFEFAAGITAVVGPNGSGKSNVVDAIKWVLGEQSAKSLRSGGMADVIFNGSTSRRPNSQAEVTLTFDNSRGTLADAAAEVRVGRRVFRDGTSEYLINGQVRRLKDVKDLFLGTGAGAGAYSIIEQGRVDALLQASQDDRRSIFEEAAGISRYKVKKIECLRRLDRVAQNLARLQDILTEVDQQLRTVRTQAAKALRFQDYSTRLKDLRVALGLDEYRTLVDKLHKVEDDVAVFRGRMGESTAHSTSLAEDIRRLEAAITEATATLREQEQIQHASKTRGELLNAAIERERELAARLDEDLVRDRHRLEAAQQNSDLSATAATQAGDDWTSAQLKLQVDEGAAQEVVAQVRSIDQTMATLAKQLRTSKSEHLEQLRDVARRQNEAVSVQAQIEQLTRERERLKARKKKAAGQLELIHVELATFRHAESEVEDRLAATREQVAVERHRRDTSINLIADCQSELAKLRSSQASLTCRIEVLESWDRDPNGVGAGIRFVLDQMKAKPLEAIVGWIPDCIIASRDDAPLIDLALGATAQHFVIRDIAELMNWLTTFDQLPGRVGFVGLNYRSAVLAELPAGVVRASELIQCCSPDLAGLPERLLGNTLVVADITLAGRISRQFPHCRFITRSGELLEADGSVIVGNSADDVGVVSRKTELRELHGQSWSLDERIADVDSELAALEDQVAAAEAALSASAQQSVVLADQLNDLRARIAQHHERRSGIQNEVSVSNAEISALSADIDRDKRQLEDITGDANAAAQTAAYTEKAILQAETAIRELEREQQQLQQQHTSAQVALARARERLDALRLRHEHAQSTVAERANELRELTKRIAAAELRAETSQSSISSACAELEEVILRQAAASNEAAVATLQVQKMQLEQGQIRAHLQEAQAEWQAINDELHACELVARDLINQRETLMARVAEDYRIDLSSTWADGTPPHLGDRTPEHAQSEIDDLRGKLQRLGSVNLEALEELAQIEHKHGELQKQFDDLTQARRSLEDSIQKINADSRRLFVETFASVKTHFQELFRRLFGGGMADIVLANEQDPLESPIDIIARPPGKELRSISLMSGGERTMTAVALLLAIFRSKPSPFCVLDEVDAALDEANTARLTQVLREFAASSQFIVITHAKRTMAAADMLYGITMQESGVSKWVAVRFDEWPDDAKKAA